jgi:uncharacterized protein (TIRG00374 family)
MRPSPAAPLVITSNARTRPGSALGAKAAGARREAPTIKALRRVIFFLLIVVVLYLLLPRLVGPERALGLVRHARWPLLVLAVVVEFVSLAGYADLFRHILRVLDVRLRFRTVMNVVLAGLSFSHLFGAGGAAGMVVSYNALRKRDVPHGLIFVAIAAQNFFTYIVLWVMFLVAMVSVVSSGRVNPWSYTLALVLIAGLLWLTAYGLYLYHHRAKMRRRVSQVAALINRLYRRERIAPENIDEWLDSLFAGMRRMGTHRGAKRTAVAYSCMFWGFDLLCLYLVFLALGYHVPLAALTVSYAVANAVGSLAPTPGGLGAIEGLMITLLVSFDVPSPQAIAVVLVYRLINFWIPIPVGFGSYLAIK